MNRYFVYIVECADKTLYVGYTTNIEGRIRAHNTLTSGARYTKIRRPVKLVYEESFQTKSEALKREYEIKQLRRMQKIALIRKKVI